MANFEITPEKGRGEDCWPESWREIGFRIWVSDFGRVWWSGPPWAHRHKPGIVKQTKLGNYWRVSLPRINGGKPIAVHRLVAHAFHGECPEHMCVDHIDGDTSNNTPENLQYVTRGENTRLYFARRKEQGLPALVNGRRTTTDVRG